MRILTQSRASGFSLIETLIAASVLAISMLGAFSAHTAARNLNRESNETELARGILEVTMERLMEAGAEDLSNGITYTPGLPVAVTETDLLNEPQLVFQTPGFTLGDPPPVVLNLRLQLTWTSVTGQRRTLSMASATR